jgi:2-polyprenyl-6-hydroxyphenyl methylase/3-demethylubiquinone-9 3-methyltransferase
MWMGPSTFVTAMEVIEHVTDSAMFVAGLARVLAPGGVLILSTPNRTERSRLMIVTLAEGFGRIPRGTHDWTRFLTPEELATLLESAGVGVVDVAGLTWSPAMGSAWPTICG